MKELTDSATDKDLASENTEIMKSAKEELTKWENNDLETRKIWKMMNEWVYDGFDILINSLEYHLTRIIMKVTHIFSVRI